MELAHQPVLSAGQAAVGCSSLGAMVRSRRLAVVVAVVVCTGVGVSGCGDDTDTPGPSTTLGPTTTGVATGSAPTTTVVVAPTTAVATGRVLEYAYAGGAVTGDGRVSVRLGEEVTIRVASDVAEEVHVHTYDLTADLGPGLSGEVTFVADIPGVHEVELEGSHLRLLSLEVQ